MVTGFTILANLSQSKEDLSFDFFVYCKPTYTLLGTIFFFIYSEYIQNKRCTNTYSQSVQSLIFILKLSKWNRFYRGFWDTNGFPKIIIDRCIEKFLNKIYNPPETIITDEICVKLSCLGKNSDELFGVFQTYLRDFHTQIKFCFINESSIGLFPNIRKTCWWTSFP